MALKRTMTVTWDGLHELEAEDDDDEFFESSNRLSTIVPLNLSTSVPLHHTSFRNELIMLSDDDDLDDDDDDDFIDTRMSFTAAVPIPIRNSIQRSFRNSIIRHSFRAPNNDLPPPEVVFPGEQMETYGIWMAAPDSIMERRKRLLQGMGLNSSKKDFNRLTTARFVSKKFKDNPFSRPPIPHHPPPHAAAHSSSTPTTTIDSHAAIAVPPSSPGSIPAPVPVSPTPAAAVSTTTDNTTTPTTPTDTTTPDSSQVADENQTQSQPQPPDVQAVITSSSSAASSLNSSPLHSPPHGHEDELSASSSSSVTPTSHSVPVFLFRSRSDSDISPYSIHVKRRKEEIIGKGVSKQKLTRTSSTLTPCARLCRLNINSIKIVRGSREAIELGLESDNTTAAAGGEHARSGSSGGMAAAGNISAFFLIKNLDTGKEFIVKEFDEEGMWNRVSDLQTGKQLTREEFEKSVGHSPLVQELMRRQSWKAPLRKAVMNNYLTKSFRMSKKKGSTMLKNIKSKAHSMRSGINVLEGKDHHHHQKEKDKEKDSGEKEKDKDKEKEKEKDKENDKEKDKDKDKEKEEKPQAAAGEVTKAPSPEWVKVRQQGKTYKDLTALRLCQEIDAHEGSIWTIKFNPEGKYLASAGEDKVIHVWESQECEVASLITQEDQSAAGGASSGGGAGTTAAAAKKGKAASKKSGVMPEYVQLPETAFALSEKPICSFTGHLDDVLDLSWSNKQPHLLSSSMDKTVRLWDIETKTCLKLFAHNDYVTCIQFNPVNDNFFISGSLDAKLRIWNVTEKRVIDWIDLHEMVTAACYSLDGQNAAVGSHKGTCRTYSTADGKLTQTSNFEIPNKNKKKVTKITGFEFTPENPSEVLVTSADSRIRIYEGTDVVQKFRGYKNTSSQIVASYTPSAKHVISASEDSNVYIWRREEPRPNNNGKAKVALTITQFEQFQCKDVSVAIPWPGSKNVKTNSSSSNDKPAGSSPTKSDGNKKQLPPLPKKNKQQQKNESNNEVDKSQDDTAEKEKEKTNEDGGDGDQNGEEKVPASGEAAETGASEGESSSAEAAASEESPSVSASPTPSAPTHRSANSWSAGWGWQGVGVGIGGVGLGGVGLGGVGLGGVGLGGGGGGQQSGGDPAAWGLVIVTAGQGGDIKIYQNFGLPVRVGNKGSLFS